MPEVLDVLIDISMVIGPVVGYIYQYFLIHKSQTLGTFSIDVCGILLFANITRMNFYIFQKYETALFFQSALMVTVQLFLLRLCKSVSKAEVQPDTDGQSKILESFWRWPTFTYYLLFVIGFSAALTGMSYAMLKADPAGFYGQLIGLIALTSESILILPQIIQNCRMGTVKGVSHLLLSFNLFGDIFKLCYFIFKNQAFQFIICGVTQVVLDTFVIMQICYYRWKNKQKVQDILEEDNAPEIANLENITPNSYNTDKKSDVESENIEPVIESNSQLTNSKRRSKRRSSRTTSNNTT